MQTIVSATLQGRAASFIKVMQKDTTHRMCVRMHVLSAKQATIESRKQFVMILRRDCSANNSTNRYNNKRKHIVKGDSTPRTGFVVAATGNHRRASTQLSTQLSNRGVLMFDPCVIDAAMFVLCAISEGSVWCSIASLRYQSCVTSCSIRQLKMFKAVQTTQQK